MIIHILVIIYITLCIGAILTLISEKRDPVKSISWIIIVLAIPYVGFVIYLFFGQNYRKRKMFQKRVYSDKKLKSITERQKYKINSPILESRPDIEQNRDLITLILNSCNLPVSYNNSTTILQNGDNTFPAIMESLKGAKHHIHLEYYMFLDDELGEKIGDILCEKAKEGVSVRVIFDDVGSWSLSKRFIKRLQVAGVEIYPFMPVIFPLLTSKINYRNHRKIVVVDGKIGYTGGLNIANKYLVGAPKLGRWRDTHLKIEGKAAHQLQAIFLADWNFVSSQKIGGGQLYPPIDERNVGRETLQIVHSGPDSNWASIMQGFFMAISRAKSHIYISTPYFLPSESILTAIKVAALGGVDVRIMIPARPDSKIVFWATRSYISELLETGAKVYLYRRGFNHSKVMCVDSRLSFIGSANMDIRSFEDNFEVTAILYNKERSIELEDRFLEDLKHSRELKLKYWRSRSWSERTLESLCRLLSPLL